MAEVGILNLQIHDNSEETAAGLTYLASALSRVKNAVRGGVQLGNVGKQIENLANKINKSVDDNVLAKIRGIAESLEGLRGLGHVTISIRGDGASDVREQMEGATSAAAKFNEELAEKVQDGASELELLHEKISIVRNELNEGIASGLFDDKKIVDYALRLVSLEKRAERLRERLEKTSDAANETKDEELFEGIDNETVDAMDDLNEQSESMADNFLKANDTISLLKMRIEALTNALNEGMTSGMWDVDKQARVAMQINRLKADLEKYEKAARTAKDATEDLVDATHGGNREAVVNLDDYKSPYDPETGYLKGYTPQDYVPPVELPYDLSKGDIYAVALLEENMKALEMEAGRTGETIEEVVARIRAYKQETEESADTTSKFRQAMDALSYTVHDLKNGIGNLGISKLVGQLFRVARMRALRYIVKQVSAAFSEGITNVYHYSEAIGSSFATSMDAATSALDKMKNSIAAAVSPAIEALIPLLQRLVNWFITLVNYVNQFFALLNGQSTWTHATDVSSSFDDITNSASGASDAVNELLADWDELNIIQSNSNGGGGGSGASAADYESMFEEVSDFADWIENIVNAINDQFGDVWKLIKKIGTALLAWKFSEVFTGILATLSGLVATGAIIDLEFNIIQMLDKRFLQTGEQGYLVANVLTTLLGGVLMKKVLGKVLGGAAAKVAMPITLAVSATADLVTLFGKADVSAISLEGLELEAMAALKGGALTGYLMYLSGGFTGALSAVTGLTSALVWMGINVGLQAINNTVDTGKITFDTIKSNLLSAGLVGAGLGLTEAVLAGAEGTIGTIFAVGGAGALMTLGALFLIEAIIETLPEKIHWGDKQLTTEQIQTFIDNEVFKNFDLKANIQLAADTVTMIDADKKDLTTKVRNLIPMINSIKLNVNVKGSLTKIDEAVNGTGGIVETFNKLQEDKQTQLVLAFSSVKIVDNSGEEKNEEFSGVFAEGYSTMSNVMTNLGKKLSAAVKNAYDESISADAREMAKKTVLEITTAMSEISAINTANQTAIDLRNQFTEGLAGVNKSSMSELLTYYKQQRDSAGTYAASQYELLLDEAELQARNYNDLAKLAQENGGEFGGYKYKDYIELAKKFEAMYEELGEYRQRSVNSALNFYQEGGDGFEKIREAMLTLTSGRNMNLNVNEYMASLFNGEDSVLLGSKAQQNVTELLKSIVLQAFDPDDRDEVEDALNTGVLNYTDFFSEEATKQLANNMGITGDARTIWNSIIAELFDKNIFESVSSAAYEKLNEHFGGIPELINRAKESIEQQMAAKPVDHTEFDKSCDEIVNKAENMYQQTMAYFAAMAHYGSPATGYMADAFVPSRPVIHKASGGFVRSGDLVMANENGNFEMMGRMGNQPVVANNQQIVNGISQGVSNANGDVVSELRSMATLVQRILNKEFSAKLVANSSTGRTVSQSTAAYSRVTG